MDYKCNICNSPSYEAVSIYRAKSRVFSGRSIVKCASCDFLSVYPMPNEEELGSYYGSYWADHKYETKMRLFRTQAEARFEFLSQFLDLGAPELNILDIGASFGLLFEVISKKMPHTSISYSATEIDPIAVEFLRKNIKPANICSNDTEVTGRYGLIVLSHIIEHLRDPKKFILRQKDRLAENGIIFVEVPNKDYLFKQYNEPHLNFFNKDTLEKLFREAGFQILRIDTCGHPLRRLSESLKRASRFKTAKKFIKKILPGYIIKRLKRNIQEGPLEEPVGHIFEYGNDRAWIRLAVTHNGKRRP